MSSVGSRLVLREERCPWPQEVGIGDSLSTGSEKELGTCLPPGAWGTCLTGVGGVSSNRHRLLASGFK